MTIYLNPKNKKTWRVDFKSKYETLGRRIGIVIFMDEILCKTRMYYENNYDEITYDLFYQPLKKFWQITNYIKGMNYSERNTPWIKCLPEGFALIKWFKIRLKWSPKIFGRFACDPGTTWKGGNKQNSSRRLEVNKPNKRARKFKWLFGHWSIQFFCVSNSFLN